MNIRNWSSCKLESKGIELVNLYIEIDPRNEILASNWGKKYDAKFGLGILPLLSLMIKYHKTTFSVTVQKKTNFDTTTGLSHMDGITNFKENTILAVTFWY